MRFKTICLNSPQIQPKRKAERWNRWMERIFFSQSFLSKKSCPSHYPEFLVPEFLVKCQSLERSTVLMTWYITADVLQQNQLMNEQFHPPKTLFSTMLWQLFYLHWVTLKQSIMKCSPRQVPYKERKDKMYALGK